MFEDGPPRDYRIRPEASSTECYYCGRSIVKDDPTVYRNVESWVHGPKLDGPVLRKQLGFFAHEECIKLIIAGQAPDQIILEGLDYVQDPGKEESHEPSGS